MTTSRYAVALCLVVLLLAGCGDGGDRETAAGSARETAGKRPEKPRKLRELVVTLAGPKSPDSAGIMMAYHRGYFEDVGLTVEVLTPASPDNVVTYVIGRADDFGVAHQPQVVMEKEKGAPIVAIESLIPQSTAAMIWLKKSRIHEIADLKGMTIAIQGLPYQKGLLESVLTRAGLSPEDVTITSVGYELVPSLVSGRADAIFGGSKGLEGVELESRGLDPVVTPVSGLGVPAYEELVWITRTDFAAKHPRLIEGFRAALRRGTAAAIEDPEAAARVIDTAYETNPELSRKEMEAGVEATLPLLSRTGYMSPGKASRLVDWMHGQGLIQRAPPPAALLTNRLVEP